MQTRKKQRLIYLLFDEWGNAATAFNSIKKAYDYVTNEDNYKRMKDKVTYQYFARQIKKKGSYYFSVRSLWDRGGFTKQRVQSVTFH